MICEKWGGGAHTSYAPVPTSMFYALALYVFLCECRIVVLKHFALVFAGAIAGQGGPTGMQGH